MTQSDDRLTLFVSVGLPEQRAKETLKNGSLSNELSDVIADAQKTAPGLYLLITPVPYVNDSPILSFTRLFYPQMEYC